MPVKSYEPWWNSTPFLHETETEKKWSCRWNVQTYNCTIIGLAHQYWWAVKNVVQASFMVEAFWRKTICGTAQLWTWPKWHRYLKTSCCSEMEMASDWEVTSNGTTVHCKTKNEPLKLLECNSCFCHQVPSFLWGKFYATFLSETGSGRDIFIKILYKLISLVVSKFQPN